MFGQPGNDTNLRQHTVKHFRQCIKMTFKINNEFVTGMFYVTSHNFQGNLSLKRNKMILNFDAKTLRLKNTEIVLESEVKNKK